MMAKEKEPAPRRAAERRTHARYGFNAAAEVTEGISGTRIEARITDLSQRGCYVQTARSVSLGTEVTLKITKGGESFDAQGRVVYSSEKGMGLRFGDIAEEQLERLEAWLGSLRERDWLVQNRRRTQRVLMRVPVRISGENAVGSQFEEETHTLAVNANGALVVLSAPVKKGQILHLLNVAMGDKAECAVAHLGQRRGELLEVGIAFRLPNPNFWRVAFPPPDWSQPIGPDEF